jgi:hypothetical protein
MNTLLLDRTIWDLVLDARGNIAVASNPYAIAQDVASAIKTFAGEVWYDNRKGIPYFDKVLGKAPPIAYYKAKCAAVALTVPEVVQARCIITSVADRTLTGQIQIIDKQGTATNVQLN